MSRSRLPLAPQALRSKAFTAAISIGLGAALALGVSAGGLVACQSPKPRFVPEENANASPENVALPDSELAAPDVEGAGGAVDATVVPGGDDVLADAAPRLAAFRARLSTGCAADSDCNRINVKVGVCHSEALIYGKDSKGVDGVRKDAEALEKEFAGKQGSCARSSGGELALECVRGSCEAVGVK